MENDNNDANLKRLSAKINNKKRTCSLQYMIMFMLSIIILLECIDVFVERRCRVIVREVAW